MTPKSEGQPICRAKSTQLRNCWWINTQTKLSTKNYFIRKWWSRKRRQRRKQRRRHKKRKKLNQGIVKERSKKRDKKKTILRSDVMDLCVSVTLSWLIINLGKRWTRCCEKRWSSSQASATSFKKMYTVGKAGQIRGVHRHHGGDC